MEFISKSTLVVDGEGPIAEGDVDAADNPSECPIRIFACYVERTAHEFGFDMPAAEAAFPDDTSFDIGHHDSISAAEGVGDVKACFGRKQVGISPLHMKVEAVGFVFMEAVFVEIDIIKGDVWGENGAARDTCQSAADVGRAFSAAMVSDSSSVNLDCCPILDVAVCCVSVQASHDCPLQIGDAAAVIPASIKGTIDCVYVSMAAVAVPVEVCVGVA